MIWVLKSVKPPQDGPYPLSKTYSMVKTSKENSHLDTYGHSPWFFRTHALTNTSSGNRIGWYIGRVDNWTGRWDTIAKAIDSLKISVLYNATVGNKEDIAGKITKTHLSLLRVRQDKGKSFPRSDYL